MRFLNNMMWSPIDYAQAAVLADAVGQEILARLEWMTVKPKIVVDIGCGSGKTNIAIRQYYKEATVFSLDATESMLRFPDHVPLSICADGGRLPFKLNSLDLIFSNFMFPWGGEAKHLLQEWQRVLAPGGLVLFTALGLDTLQEWRSVFQLNEIPVLYDMHDLGDLLLQVGFAEPVLEVDHYTINYRNIAQLQEELIASGMWYPQSLSQDGQDIEKQFAAISTQQEGVWSVTYEVIYAHAFKPVTESSQSVDPDGTTVRVPLTNLKR